MNIYINEMLTEAADDSTAFGLKEDIKPEADIVILNGYLLKEDLKLKDGDRLFFIKRGEVPSSNEIEMLLTSRHTPGVHEKLKKAYIGIAGLGGLGSNAAVSLARMGIGKLLLVDFDVVEPSNLNRQYYFVRHIGMKKTDALEEIIEECNPYVIVEKRDLYLDSSNIGEVFKDVDIIIEAFDNPESKAILTNVVMDRMENKPLVAASGMAGYSTGNTIISRRVWDNFYVIGDLENGAEPGMGLMAPRVGIAANQQANTAIRIILGEE